MRRAVKETQKQKRRQSILAEAWRLFQKNSYTAVNMLDVARGVGVAKGTLYLYFKTKEALFLAILTEKFEAWFAAVDAQLEALEGESDPREMAHLIGRSLSERPGLTRLFALLHIILEHNVEREAALAFKQMLKAHVAQTGALLEARLPFLAAGEGGRLLLRIYALVLGVQQLANPAPVVREIMAAEPEMALFQVDFEEMFVAATADLIAGLRGRSAELSTDKE